MRHAAHWIGGGVLVYSVAGMVTLRSGQVLRRRIEEVASRRCARALVLDLRQAVLVLTRADWVELSASRAHWFVGQIPMATLCGPELLAPLEVHALRMAQQGYLRDVFTDEAQAVEWAQLWAPVWPPRRRLGEVLAAADQEEAPAAPLKQSA
jgi:hypothetical protein